MLSWSASFGNTPGADSSSRKLPLSNGTGPATESTTRFARQPASHGRQHQSFNDDPHRGWFPQMPMRTLRDSEYRAFGLKTRTDRSCRHAAMRGSTGRKGRPANSTVRSPKTDPVGKKPKTALHHKFNHLIELWEKASALAPTMTDNLPSGRAPASGARTKKNRSALPLFLQSTHAAI